MGDFCDFDGETLKWHQAINLQRCRF